MTIVSITRKNLKNPAEGSSKVTVKKVPISKRQKTLSNAALISVLKKIDFR